MARRGGLGAVRIHARGGIPALVRPVSIAAKPSPMIRMASSERRGRGPERWTTGVPAPIITLARRLLLLSRWSRETGLGIVIVTDAAAGRPSLRSGGASRSRPCSADCWMPDEDSNLD